MLKRKIRIDFKIYVI